MPGKGCTYKCEWRRQVLAWDVHCVDKVAYQWNNLCLCSHSQVILWPVWIKGVVLDWCAILSVCGLAGASSSLQMFAHNLTLTFKWPGWFLKFIAWFNLNRKRYSYDKWLFVENKTLCSILKIQYFSLLPLYVTVHHKQLYKQTNKMHFLYVFIPQYLYNFTCFKWPFHSSSGVHKFTVYAALYKPCKRV